MLSCHAVLDTASKSISALVLSLLVEEEIETEPDETDILANSDYVQIGDNFDRYATKSVRMILDGKWAEAALVQQIQPGCGLYFTGIEVEKSSLTFNGTTNQQFLQGLVRRSLVLQNLQIK